MVKFLIQRPIAVLMTVLAISVLGALAFLTMPVSLLPDIDIPVIKVKVNYPTTDARNLENIVVRPLRQQLMQVGGLADIESETNDGFSNITLRFSHVTKIEYAYLEVNEKVDAITGQFPREMERPQVIRSKPSDIPVFYISIVPSSTYYQNGKKFGELSEYVQTVVKKRLEQISDVSMVDITGLDYPQITISPKSDKLENMGLDYDDISKAIVRNNISMGNLSFRNGHYIYRLRYKPSVKTVEDLKQVSLGNGSRLFKLEDIADVVLESNPGDGMFLHNNSRAISMAVYKQADARMQDVRLNVGEVIGQLKSSSLDVEYYLERDQTQLLNYSLKNLEQTLFLGILLAMVLLFLFIRQPKLPVIISISIPVSLVISFLFLNLSGLSLNIISLSGLILSVGLMIDNSIIVIDNINQYRLAGQSSFDATITGTNEVIRPLLSSVLTTCAVFVPMIALSGIAGALFFDQAITITLSLMVSLFVSIMVIPVLYHALNKNSPLSSKARLSSPILIFYEKALSFVMRRKVFFTIIFFLLIPLGFLQFSMIKKEKFPPLDQKDLIARIEWNEPLSLNENEFRTRELLSKMSPNAYTTSAYVGKNRFSLSGGERQSVNATMLYLNFDSIVNISELSIGIKSLLSKEFPAAEISFSPSENIFQTIFSPQEVSVKAKFRDHVNQNITSTFVEEIGQQITHSGLYDLNEDSHLTPGYELYPDFDKLLLYNLQLASVISKLEVLFGGSVVDELSSGNRIINIMIRTEKSSIFETIANETVKNDEGINIPLSAVLSFKQVSNLKSIKSDKQGEYFGVSLDNTRLGQEEIEEAVTKSISTLHNTDVSFEGGAYEQDLLFREFAMVLAISLILLYLILAAQFELLLLPFIILIEIAIDISGALFFLYIFESSLNLMSGLGIIVMGGIVINDSIIKVDTIRQVFNSGTPLLDAIYEGGKRRFKPIVMTSLTTILALVPLLFMGGLGVELQIPLALSIIGGLLLGTIVSLFFIPIMFFYFSGKPVQV